MVLLAAAVLVGLGAAISDGLGVSRESWATPYGLAAGGLGAFYLVVLAVVCVCLVGALFLGVVQAALAFWRWVRQRGA